MAHEPIVAPIDFEVDVSRRRGRLKVAGVTEGRGEPIKNPVTGAEHRVRIDRPNGFEYTSLTADTLISLLLVKSP